MQNKTRGFEQQVRTSGKAMINSKENSLRNLSADEFAALGGEDTVFVRSITARELARFLPEAKTMPGDLKFQMVMAANGSPILVTDSQVALSDWFEQNDFDQVQRH